MSRRPAAQIAQDRQAILAYFAAQAAPAKAPSKFSLSDLDALVASGQLVKEVRREWDKQNTPESSRHFGGAGVMQRHRAYYKIAQKEQPKMRKSYEIYNSSSVQLLVREEDEVGMGRTVMEVMVYFQPKFGGDPKAEVNWSAMGSQEPEVAYQYSRMLARAAEIAFQLDARRLSLAPFKSEISIESTEEF